MHSPETKSQFKATEESLYVSSIHRAKGINTDTHIPMKAFRHALVHTSVCRRVQAPTNTHTCTHKHTPKHTCTRTYLGNQTHYQSHTLSHTHLTLKISIQFARHCLKPVTEVIWRILERCGPQPDRQGDRGKVLLEDRETWPKRTRAWCFRNGLSRIKCSQIN